jgi:hypothetical protein
VLVASAQGSDFHQGHDGTVQLGYVERLDDVGARSRPDEPGPLAWIGVVGQDHDRGLVGEHSEAKVVRHVGSIDIRKIGIEHHEPRAASHGQLQSGAPASRNDDVHTLPTTSYPSEGDAVFRVTAYVEQRSIDSDPGRGVPAPPSQGGATRLAEWLHEAKPRRSLLSGIGLHVS